MSSLRRLLTVILLTLVCVPTVARAEKLRDLCEVVGARDNQLVGYGVVTGLNGTGDDVSAPFAAQSLRSLLRRLGIQLDSKQLRLKNVAAVVVSTTIPAFTRNGQALDVTVSSIGNARSLQGGVLIQTPLRGADRRTYAVAQGPLIVGGYSASGSSGSSQTKNSTNTARIPAAALVEREIPTQIVQKGVILLSLREPSFSTAARIVEVIRKEHGKESAKSSDAGAVEIKVPDKFKDDPVGLVAALGDLEVETVQMARVIINERTGTIVAGGDVRLTPVAIAHGGITVSVKEQQKVSQPGAFAGGNTATTNESDVAVNDSTPSQMTYVPGAASLAEVAQALTALGVSAQDMASILQALRTAGALRAEVIVQ
jgi:flagellar P-ring protein precursor FlgI